MNTSDSPAGFAELHCITNYSFLRGASHPEELVQGALDLGYKALAITDECSVSGVVKAYLAARETSLKLIVGAEFHCADGFTLVLLAPSRIAYGQLCTLITRLRRRAQKGSYHIELGDLDRAISECIGLWIPFGGELGRSANQTSTAPSTNTMASHALATNATDTTMKKKGAARKKRRTRAASTPSGSDDNRYDQGVQLRDISTLINEGRALQKRLPKLYLALELFLDQHDLDKTALALTLSMRLNLAIVATNDVHLHHPARKPLQDVLTAIRHGSRVSELGFELQSNSERHLQPLTKLQRRYPAETLHTSLTIANQCHFSLDELRYEYPAELVPPHYLRQASNQNQQQNEQQGASAYLRDLTYHGAGIRWPGGIPEPVRLLIEKELVLIRELSYEHYFLTVHDIVQFARSKDILCQGRGSAANSAVCYCLFITEVDPDRMHLLFERFVSKERNEPPDIDVDFEHERREEVIQYIYTRYTRERAALAATLITYRPKSAIRDVGKALGLDTDLLDLLAKSMTWWDNKDELAERFRNAGIDPKSRVAKQFLFLVQQIMGFPRHLSQHVGGFLISRGPIAQLVPVENAAMVDRTVIQWDKDDLEALGLLKIDVLALGMLTAIRKAIDLHNEFYALPADKQLSVSSIPAEDQATYAMLQRGDSVGVFQVESRAQMAMLPRLKPQNFYDLVVEVAIVRPGPIQGDMVHPYLRRRQGLETPTYSNDAVRAVLERTLGVPIFQEQVIELAMVAAGFTAGEADQLRRAMAAWKRRGGLAPFQDKLINGMLERGHDIEFAERVFKQIQGFGEYGFPESHAASFALLVYISAWLKQHSPAAFYCGLLNSLPMGFYSASQLIQDARRHDVEVLPIDVQHSDWHHQLVPTNRNAMPALRLGLRQVKGLREPAGESIMAARTTDHRHFLHQTDLQRSTGLNRQSLEFLARAGALNSLSQHRHQAHWDVAGLSKPMPLEEVADARGGYGNRPEHSHQNQSQAKPKSTVTLAAPSDNEDMLADYRYTSLTLGAHPMTLLRNRGLFQNCKTALSLNHYRHGQFVRIAGLVTGRQRPGTAAGVMFLTLEDETGNSNIVVWESVLQQFRAAILQGHLLLIKGVVERESEVIHVIAGHISDRSDELHQIAAFKSRDFH